MATQPKRLTTFAQAALYTIIAIAILGAINFLANRYNKSFDTTSNKRFTLSDQTAKIAKDLKDDLTISFWDRPDSFNGAKDLLDRYQNLSSKIKVEYNDIDKNKTQAIAAGISKRGDITVKVGNKTEQAKSLTEEEVTGAMVRALKGGDRLVCFTAGYGDNATGDSGAEGYAGVKAYTEKNNYKTQTASLIPVPSIPKECTVLVVGGPKRDYLQPTADAIKGYVEAGGHALIMLDPPLKFGSQVDDNNTLTKVLETWGISLHKDVVLDARGEQVGLGAQYPVAGEYGDHPVVRALKTQGLATVFPLSRSMDAASAGSAETAPLVKTGPSAVSKEDLTKPEVGGSVGPQGPRTLAMAGTLKDGAKGRFVVVGTSAWIGNSGLGLGGNRDLYMNMLNWLSSDEDLIAIRPKDPEDRRLNMNARQMTVLFWGSVIGLPVLMMLAGISVWWRRR
ncbi:MAG: GldG family protein [Acidobacteriota bacterium]